MRGTMPLIVSCVVVMLGLASIVAVPNEMDIARLIQDLASDEQPKRQEAARKLEQIGEPALEALRRTAKEHPDVDVRLRAFVLIRDIETGPFEALSTVKGLPGYWLNRIAFTPDGKQIIATGGAVIWYEIDRASGKEVRRTLERQFARRGLALSSDGRYFLTGHQSDPVLRLGDLATGKEARTFEGHTKGVSAVTLSSDLKWAASGGEDLTLRIWDLKSGQELRQVQGKIDKVLSLAFHSDGKQLASGHAGGQVRIWDVETGKELAALKGHGADVTSVKWLPDGRSLLSSSQDGTVRLWDIEGGKERLKMEHPGGASDVAVTPNGRWALSAGWDDKMVRLWDLTTGRERHRFEGHGTRVLGVAISPDGKRAVSCDATSIVRLWQLAP